MAEYSIGRFSNSWEIAVMRALVTGACGFVGGYLVPHLLDCHDEVCATYLVKRAFPSPSTSEFLDITDAESCKTVISKYNPTVIYPLAGIAFPPDAEKDFARALSINVAGTHNVFAAAAACAQPPKVVLISSAQVYGQIAPTLLPLTESTPLNPGDNYSLSKVMSELVAERFSRHFKVPTVIVRPFNHIGAGQRQDFAVSNFANQLAQISKKSRAPVLHVGNLEAQRDFTDVRDIVRGYRLAAQSGKGTYNLCSGTPIAMSEILDRLIKISGSQVTLEQDPSRMRRSDTPLLYGSAAKAKADFGWAPEHSLDASLKHVYDFWLKS